MSAIWHSLSRHTRRAALIGIAICVATSGSARAQTDPLPSWNGGTVLDEGV